MIQKQFTVWCRKALHLFCVKILEIEVHRPAGGVASAFVPVLKLSAVTFPSTCQVFAKLFGAGSTHFPRPWHSIICFEQN